MTSVPDAIADLIADLVSAASSGDSAAVDRAAAELATAYSRVIGELAYAWQMVARADELRSPRAIH